MAITADNTVIPASKHLDNEGMKVDYEVAASTVIYRNSFVGLNATGYLTSFVAPASGLTRIGTKFVGIALEAIESQTSDGDARCRVLIDGYFQYTLSSTDRVDIGTPVFASDNATLVMVGTTGNLIGHIVGFPGSNLALVKLVGPIAGWAGQFLHVVSPPIDWATDAHIVQLVHETQNPNGLLLWEAACFVTEVFASTSAEGVVTLRHSTSTTLGCTFASIDAMAAGDVITAIAGSMVGAEVAAGTSVTPSNAPVVLVPAGKNVHAFVSTVVTDASPTGQSNIIATFVAM